MRPSHESASDPLAPSCPLVSTCVPQVPAYAHFIKERFERCLDLYLCPRTRRKRLIIEGARAPRGAGS